MKENLEMLLEVPPRSLGPNTIGSEIKKAQFCNYNGVKTSFAAALAEKLMDFLPKTFRSAYPFPYKLRAFFQGPLSPRGSGHRNEQAQREL